jgi:hypothetical protein
MKDSSNSDLSDYSKPRDTAKTGTRQQVTGNR